MKFLDGGSDGEGSACNARDQVWSLGQEVPLEEGNPMDGEAGGLQSTRLCRIVPQHFP